MRKNILISLITIMLLFPLFTSVIKADDYSTDSSCYKEYNQPYSKIALCDMKVQEYKGNSTITIKCNSKLDIIASYLDKDFTRYGVVNIDGKKYSVKDCYTTRTNSINTSITALYDSDIYEVGSYYKKIGYIPEGSTIEAIGSRTYIDGVYCYIFSYDEKYYYSYAHNFANTEYYSAVKQYAEQIMDIILTGDLNSQIEIPNSIVSAYDIEAYLNIKYFNQDILADYLKFKDDTCFQYTNDTKRKVIVIPIAKNRENYYRTIEYVNYLKDVIKSLDLENKSELEKIYAIEQYVADHIEYDFTLNKHGSVKCMMENAGVCVDYAASFYSLCTIVGIEAQHISGDTYCGGHAWNRVKYNNKFYYVDVCYYDYKKDSSYRLFEDGDKSDEERVVKCLEISN